MGWLNFGSQNSKTSMNQQTDPWDVAIPQLQEFLQKIEGMQSQGFQIGPEQQAIFDQLKGVLSAGNPNTDQIKDLATKLLGTESNSPAIQKALEAYQAQVTPVANGENIKGFADNPYIQQMLQQNGNDIMTRINSQFASAGRDLSGINQQAVARGISQGTLPTLADLYSKEVGRTDAARTGLLSGTLSGVAGENSSDSLAAQLANMGIDVSKAGIDASTSGLNSVLNLLQQQKELPIANAGQFLQLLGGVAGLGNQSSGTSKTNSTGFGFSLSDERAKENAEPIGVLADGTTIYRFNYKGEPKEKVQIGVMAQEIEKRNPEAVATSEDGTKYVNYGTATAKSAGLLRQGV